jgi:predicted adenylyl cyclase CyaB
MPPSLAPELRYASLRHATLIRVPLRAHWLRLQLSQGDLVPRNIEIKARIASVEAVEPGAAALADQGPIAISQDDTFFHCKSGRLKLRVFGATDGELIFYRRADQQGPKESFYKRAPTTSPEDLREALSLAYGQSGRVVKQRTLYLIGRTRVHLDRVEGLGHFLELEVVLEDDEAPEAGVREAHLLMSRLAVEPSDLIETAYVDLLAKKNGATAPASNEGLASDPDVQ